MEIAPHSALVLENAAQVSNEATVATVASLQIARQGHQIAARQPVGPRRSLTPRRSQKTLLTIAAIGRVARKAGIDAVHHGFRSSFRDWAAERTETPHAVMEAALAHTVRNATERAYARSHLFERRRALMQQRSDYVGTGAARRADLRNPGTGRR